MSVLVIELLGGFSARWDDTPITFESDKARALLANLVVERGKVHRRETLAGLLWPDMPEKRARANLNQATYSLRQALEESGKQPLLLSDRHSLRLNPDFHLHTDVVAFETALATCHLHDHDDLTGCHVCRATLAKAADLYSGPFLDGLSLPGCNAFEEWMALRREFVARQATEVMQQLAASHESADEIEAALVAARRWVELAPWQEAAHRRVMRLLALAGRRSEAVAYGERSCSILRDEFGVEPRESTRWLLEDLRAGRIRARKPEVTLRKLSIDSTSPPASQSRQSFVGRDAQVGALQRHLEQTLAGEGQIVFVAGEAGAGKTALLLEIARMAHNQHPDLLVIWGQSNAFAGSGDPFLPFRQMLSLITGEAERGYQMGFLDEDQAQRLWKALPQIVEALFAQAPGLVEAFLPGVDLLARVSREVEDGSGWLATLRTEAASRKDVIPLHREQLREQTIRFLRDLSKRQPLVLLFDDLQWVDADSVSLLFHLARSLAGLRLLVVCAYRPEEVDVGRDGRLHPLKPLLAECKRITGIQPLNLNRLHEEERRQFTNQLIDCEHNQLNGGFRQALFNYTDGHALFTVETLHRLQTQGILVQRLDQGWVQQAPDWEAMSPRVEGAIEARIARLPEYLQALLAVASVDGEHFSAQTLAIALDQPLAKVLGGLSVHLDRVHRLVTEAGKSSVNKNSLDYFCFRHSLFRQHVYDHLDEKERRLLHEQVGSILETRYGNQAPTIAPQLALHFDLGDAPERALAYYVSAGDQARLLYAEKQATAAYERALALAQQVKNDEQAARIHMRMGLTYQTASNYQQAQASYAEGFRLWSQPRGAPSLPPAERPLRMMWGLASRNEEPTFDLIPDLFSGLVEETPNLAIVPDIAYEWQIEEGGRRYVFHLRDDVYWSDGELVTAHDFSFAWQHNRLPDPASGTPLYNLKASRLLDYGITADLQQAEVEIPDPFTLVINLPQPASYFLHLLSHPLAAPKPKHAVKRYGEVWATAENIVSNGPFLLEHWDTGQDRMRFVRNTKNLHYASGNVTRVEALYFRQPHSWQHDLELYEQDLLDILHIFTWPRQGFETARRRHLVEYCQYPLFTTFLYCFDTTRPPFDDVRVRRAFVLALDREQFYTQLMTQVDKPTHGGFIPPGMPGHSPDIGLSYDPDQARRLLAEAGYAKGRGFPSVELVQFYTPGGEKSVRYFSEHWRKQLGIPMTHKLLEWAAYWRYLAHGSPHIMAMNGAGAYGDPDAVMRQSFRTVQQLTGWHHFDYERLIAEASGCQIQEKRLRLYQQADALLIQQAPIFPVRYHDIALLAKPWVKYVPRSPVTASPAYKGIVLDHK